MPAGRTQQRPVGLCRRHGRAAGLSGSTRATNFQVAAPTTIDSEGSDLPRDGPGLATKQLEDDRAAGIAGGHAGRPDPAASHRSVPTARPGSWAGSTRVTNFQVAAPTWIYPEMGFKLQLNKPIGLRG